MILNEKPQPITLEQVLAELERELKARKKVYPRWADNPQNTEHTPEVCQYRYDCIKAAIKLLTPQTELF